MTTTDQTADADDAAPARGWRRLLAPLGRRPRTGAANRLRHGLAAGVLVLAGAAAGAAGLWLGDMRRSIDLSVLSPGGGAPMVTALVWDGPQVLTIGTAGAGIAQWSRDTGVVQPDATRPGATVLAFPPLPEGAVFAERPALVLAPPVLPGAGDDLQGDAPGSFAREARVPVLSFRRSADAVAGQLVASAGLVAVSDGGNRVILYAPETGVETWETSTVGNIEAGFGIGLAGPSPLSRTDVRSLLVSADGQQAVVGGSDGTIIQFVTPLAAAEGDGAIELIKTPFPAPGDQREVPRGTAVVALAMGGAGEGSVIAAAAEDGRVAVLLAVDPDLQPPEALPLRLHEPFRIGLPALDFAFVPLVPPNDAIRTPLALSENGQVAVVWNEDAQVFERYDAITGRFRGQTVVSAWLETRVAAVLQGFSPDELAAVLAFAPLVAAENPDGSIEVELESPTFRVDGTAADDLGGSAVWGGPTGEASVLDLESGTISTNGLMAASPVEVVAVDAAYRPGTDRLVILASSGETVDVQIDGGSTTSRTGMLAFGTGLPDNTYRAAQLSLPRGRAEDIVLWRNEGEGDADYALRYDRLTGEALDDGVAILGGGELVLADHAPVAVAAADGQDFRVIDLISGETTGALRADGDVSFYPAPSGDGQSFGFVTTPSGAIFVIHSTARAPGGVAELPGLSFDASPIRPPPQVAPGGLALSADGRVLLLRARDGQLFAGQTDAPVFRDNDDPLQACCLHLHPLLPGVPAVAAVLAADGGAVYTVGADHLLRRISPQARAAPLPLLQLAGPVTAMALSPDGGLLALASSPGGLVLLDTGRAGRVAALGRLGHAPYAAPPQPLAKPPLAVPAPSRPGGTVVLLSSHADLEAAQAAQAAARLAGIEAGIYDSDGAFRLLVPLDGLSPLSFDNPPLLAQYEGLAAARLYASDASLHQMAALCPAQTAQGDTHILCTAGPSAP